MDTTSPALPLQRLSFTDLPDATYRPYRYPSKRPEKTLISFIT